MSFYLDVLETLLNEKILSRDDRILVVCGGIADRDAFEAAGFSDVTISNLDTRRNHELEPFEWSLQDAENLSYKDEEFDSVVVNAGLHHCRSPHRALLEMYRVARKNVLVFESRDSLLVKASKFVNITEEYEISAVVDDNGEFGGIRNTGIPNYVYRWTEKEVIKSINSYAPYGRHTFRFFYSLGLPFHLLSRKSRLLRIVVMCMSPLIKTCACFIPTLCNQMAFFIKKPQLPNDIHPWLEQGEKGLVFKKS